MRAAHLPDNVLIAAPLKGIAVGASGAVLKCYPFPGRGCISAAEHLPNMHVHVMLGIIPGTTKTLSGTLGIGLHRACVVHGCLIPVFWNLRKKIQMIF